MKISKVFAGLVVCGALIFPGALSSSAQEIDSSDLPESINYSTEQETEQSLNYSAINIGGPSISAERYTSTYQGISIYESRVLERPIPQAPGRYAGTLYYVANESYYGNYVYRGTLYLQ
ncbi:hypothetical protein [Lysinibacillus sp. NPDC059133]|uniref:hypothetical protein n=1 Tax=Lysinibacillus sp. NPDC059133 TaxID=3346737 RepID=UPI0036AF1140